jgi:hypothetical protein
MMPGFDYGFGYFTQKVPLVDVENQIQCEISDFIKSHSIAEAGEVPNQQNRNTFLFSQLFDPDQAAQVTVSLVTDLNGKVTFTGIDLSKFGLTFLSDFIAISNKLPTLQAYFQPKQEVTASIVFAMPQTYWDRVAPPPSPPLPGQPAPKPPQGPNYYIKPDGTRVYADGSPVPPSEKHPPPTSKSPPPPNVVIAGFNRVDGFRPKWLPPETSRIKPCDDPLTQSWPKRFFIKEWLTNFFTRNVKDGEIQSGGGNTAYVGDVYYSAACHKTLTLKTQIALIFDASAGAQPVVSTFILPISGWTWEINPQITQTLEIDFAMRNQDNQALCNQLLTRSPIGAPKS